MSTLLFIISLKQSCWHFLLHINANDLPQSKYIEALYLSIYQNQSHGTRQQDYHASIFQVLVRALSVAAPLGSAGQLEWHITTWQSQTAEPCMRDRL